MFGSGWKGYTGAAIMALSGFARMFGAPVPDGLEDGVFALGSALGIFGIRDAQGGK